MWLTCWCGRRAGWGGWRRTVGGRSWGRCRSTRGTPSLSAVSCIPPQTVGETDPSLSCDAPSPTNRLYLYFLIQRYFFWKCCKWYLNYPSTRLHFEKQMSHNKYPVFNCYSSFWKCEHETFKTVIFPFESMKVTRICSCIWPWAWYVIGLDLYMYLTLTWNHYVYDIHCLTYPDVVVINFFKDLPRAVLSISVGQ